MLLFVFGAQHMLGGGKHVAGMVTALQAYCERRVGGIAAKSLGDVS